MYSLLMVGVLFALPDTQPTQLTPIQLDALVQTHGFQPVRVIGDEQFLRRITLDLIGRQPTISEMTDFAKRTSADKRSQAIDRLLASDEFGNHWANYWSETIRFRVPPPELTFLNYTWLKSWFAEQLNKGSSWGDVVSQLLIANGNVKKNPAATFIGYHQGRQANLAAETARIFLGVQLQCAECHDHKFDKWKREDFHNLAAFFARTSGKLGKAQDGSGTMVKAVAKGEWRMPNVKDPRKKGATMTPVVLTGEKLSTDADDAKRRSMLAEWITSPDNPWFAKAYVNRIWARTTGRGFYEPVDDMADYQPHTLPKVHAALADHFAATKFDIKDLFRVILNSKTYQRGEPLGMTLAKRTTNMKSHAKINGDEVFQSLVKAIGLPNLQGKQRKATAAERFPPPPKSTRDVVADRFNFDPSYCPEEVSRTMSQAMLLMNNKQIHAQIDADPKSGTLLSRLLLREKDDRKAAVLLFKQVLARTPTDREIGIAMKHIASVKDRGEAFEDLMWSLINTAEFTTKR